jgi:hypothetical protein
MKFLFNLSRKHPYPFQWKLIIRPYMNPIRLSFVNFRFSILDFK